MVNGQPAGNAMIAFHPLGTADKRAPRPVAITASDGTYRLTTYQPGDGAPAGEYAVTVNWIDASLPVDECVDPFAHDRLKGRYTDPASSPWQVTILQGYNAVPLEVTTSWSGPRQRDLQGK